MTKKKRNFEKQYKIAYKQYHKIKLEVKQLKDKIKKEINPNRLQQLQHILLEKKQISQKLKKRKENALFKTRTTYQKQQQTLKFNNMMQYRLKRMFEDNKKKYSKNHIHSVNKIINDICKNKNEQEIYAERMKEKEKPVMLFQIYSQINT